MKAFHYLLKDDGNPEVSNPISLKYATQIIIIICYENKDWLILRLFCYKNQIIFFNVSNCAYSKYLFYIQVIFNLKLRKRETRYRINPSERPQ